MMPQSKFTDQLTICIPVYERYDYFEEAVNSAIQQTVKCRVIVVDNASSHNKFERFVQEKALDYLEYQRNPVNVGMVNNWNKCIEYADTKWVSILHDDDVLADRFIEFILTKMNSDDGVIAYAVKCSSGPDCKTSEFSFDSSRPPRMIDRTFFLEGVLPPPGFAVNREIALNIRFEPESYPVQDLVFYYELSLRGKIMLCSNTLAFYRYATTQTSSTVAQQLIDKAYDYRLSKANGWMERYLACKAADYTCRLYRNLYLQNTLSNPVRNTDLQIYHTLLKVSGWFRKMLKMIKSLLT